MYGHRPCALPAGAVEQRGLPVQRAAASLWAGARGGAVRAQARQGAGHRLVRGGAHLSQGAHVPQSRPLLREPGEHALHPGDNFIHAATETPPSFLLLLRGPPAWEVESWDAAVAGGRGLGGRRLILPGL